MSDGERKADEADDDEAEGSDRRIDPRHLACFPAHLQAGEGPTRSALIRDLSVSGALLLTRAKLAIGDTVHLSLYFDEDMKAYPAVGTVVREERRAGALAHPWTKSVAVRFDRPLDDIEPQIKALADKQALLFGRSNSK
jgi:PilZ domain